MTGTLQTIREELVTALAGLGVTTYDHVPARAALPSVFIMPGSPYIEHGLTFDTKRVRFGAVLLTAPSLNQHETRQLDARIEQTLHDLTADDWTVERVEQPRIEDLSDTEVLATTIQVATDATLT